MRGIGSLLSQDSKDFLENLLMLQLALDKAFEIILVNNYLHLLDHVLVFISHILGDFLLLLFNGVLDLRSSLLDMD